MERLIINYLLVVIMAKMDETTQKIILFLGLVVLVGAIVALTISLVGNDANQLGDLGKDLENLDEDFEIDFEEETFELDEDLLTFSDSVKPDHIQKGSLKIYLNDVYAKDSGDGWDLYFEVVGEDLIIDEEQSKDQGNFYFRSPFSWNADLLRHRSELVPLLTCDYNTEGRFWNSTYCISLEELDDSYFGQTVRLVYTDLSVADVEESSLLALTREDRTFVFELSVPAEFYENND